MNKKKPAAVVMADNETVPAERRVPAPPPHVIPPAAEAPPPEVNPEATGPQRLKASINGSEFVLIGADRKGLMIDWNMVKDVALRAQDGHPLIIEETICVMLYLVREQFR